MSNATTLNVFARFTQSWDSLMRAWYLRCLQCSSVLQSAKVSQTESRRKNCKKVKQIPKFAFTHFIHTHIPEAALLHPAGSARVSVRSAVLSSPSGFPSPSTAPFAPSLSEEKQLNEPMLLINNDLRLKLVSHSLSLIGKCTLPQTPSSRCFYAETFYASFQRSGKSHKAGSQDPVFCRRL